MNVWFTLVKCPYCNMQREIHIGQKKCKCPNCKKQYNVKK